MEIVIFDGRGNVMIRGGERSFELCEQRTQKGESQWYAVMWFCDLAALFSELLKRKVRTSDAKSLKELRTAIKAAKEELTAVWALETPLRDKENAYL